MAPLALLRVAAGAGAAALPRRARASAAPRAATTTAGRCASPPPPPPPLLRRPAAPLSARAAACSAHTLSRAHASGRVVVAAAAAPPPSSSKTPRPPPTTTAAQDAAWHARLAELRAYAASHGGSTDVPQTCASHPQLGQWVNKQRSHYRDGTLAPARAAALRALGFDFAPYERSWEAHYARLVAYAAAHGGDTRVPRGASAPEDVRAMGEWLNRQKRLRTAGKLAREREEQLEALDVRWSTPKAKQAP
jgi:hypothetical protein